MEEETRATQTTFTHLSGLSPNATLMLKISAGLWVFWGIAHVAFGIVTISEDIPGILESNDVEAPDQTYPDLIEGIANQLGFYLIWFGVVTTIGGFYIWRQNINAIYLSALVGGLADLGYLIFVDLPGYAPVFPGRLMTFISGGAIILSFYVSFTNKR